MTLETGNNPGRRNPKRGFSLIEIVLVLALVTVAGSIVIANFASMADRGDARTTEELIREAVKEARFLAASERRITSLEFDKDSGTLRVGGENISETTFQLDADFSEGSGWIKFFLVPPAEGLGRFNEAERSRLETQQVRFAPDRSSSPFVVEIDRGSATPERLVFDPFSSLVVKKTE